jgi:metallophosphoesterase (TIGR00282 family)
MKILYLGDVMGEPGIAVVERELPKLKRQHKPTLTIAQAENVSDGKSMLPADMKRLRKAGVDFFSGGNHTPRRDELKPFLEEPNQPVIGPANMTGCPGPGYKYVGTPAGKVLVITILGETFSKNKPEITNPIMAIDKILAAEASVQKVATVVNFHGDYSSEKVIMGHYLDGRVSMMVGDHWHVPTADAMILPKGTAYQTDVGMCGTLRSSLGVTFDSVIPRWRDNQQTKNVLATTPPFQLNALMATIDQTTGLATGVTTIRIITS